MKKLLTLTFIALLGCTSNKEDKQAKKVIFHTKEPYWRAVLETPGGDLPFNFDLFEKEGAYYAELHNDTEKLLVENIKVVGDSIFIPGYIFESEIRAKIVDGDHLIGKYVRYDTKEPYEMPFYAIYHQNFRFSPHPLPARVNITGNWDVTFNHDGEITKAKGVFKQDGNKLAGTFLTTTGDYRFLDGEVDGSQIHLSCFDGAHAFLFNAESNSSSDSIAGFFNSGKHWEETWTAVRNDSFELPDAGTLTHLKEGYDRFEFEFPSVEDGKMISSKDDRFKGKVTVVQIMGSWCPNCMDETLFLTEMKKEFPEIEIIGLAFEKSMDFEIASKRVKKVRDKLKATYPFVLAGSSNKKEAAKALPMLDHILSFPTTIMIDKKGHVRDIHTGFTGPGTGDVYQKFADQYVLTLKKLLNE